MKKLICAVTVLAVGTFSSVVQAGVIRYVDDDAPGGGDGLSWNTAYQDIQFALDDAIGGSVILIRVGQGFYAQGVVLDLQSGVALVGGFAGFGAIDPNDRNVDLFPTVVSGQNAHRVINHNAGGTAVLDGITIQDGAGGGGAGLTVSNGSLTANDCTFFNNSGSNIGGAVLVESASPATFTNCNFQNNIANEGAAIGAWQNAIVYVISCSFEGNTAIAGGALYTQQSVTLILQDCTFIGNTSTQIGGACRFHSAASVELHDCLFSLNSSLQGGAISSSIPLTLVSCVFNTNIATNLGGAIYFQDTDTTAIKCSFTANSAGAGGAFYVLDGDAEILNCRFWNNNAVLGGAIGTKGGTISVINCSLSDNTASDSAGGIWATAGVQTVTNSILWANSDLGGMDESAQIDGIAISPTVNYSVVQGGWTGDGGIGNISSDPMFVDGPSGDLHLLSGSPCIDAGDSTAVPSDEFDIDGNGNTGERLPLDLDGNPRFVDDPDTPDSGCGFPAVVDMGVYEFQGLAFVMKIGDLDGDAAVGITDFLALLAAWGQCAEACCLEDLDNDSFVGITDFLILLGNWG